MKLRAGANPDHAAVEYSALCSRQLPGPAGKVLATGGGGRGLIGAKSMPGGVLIRGRAFEFDFPSALIHSWEREL